MRIDVRSGIGERSVACGPDDQYRLMFEAFSGAVLAGRNVPPTPMSDAIANMKVIDALFYSVASGGWSSVVL